MCFLASHKSQRSVLKIALYGQREREEDAEKEWVSSTLKYRVPINYPTSITTGPSLNKYHLLSFAVPLRTLSSGEELISSFSFEVVHSTILSDHCPL